MTRLFAVFLAALSLSSCMAHVGTRPGEKRPKKIFHIYVNDGEMPLADGNSTYVVSFVAWNDMFEEAPPGAKLPAPTIPAPTMRVKLGDEVNVVMHNTGHHSLPRARSRPGVRRNPGGAR